MAEPKPSRRPSRFYALLTFAAWLASGIAAVRWPESALAKEFHALTIVLALMLREAMARSQDYYLRAAKREDGENKKGINA